MADPIRGEGPGTAPGTDGAPAEGPGLRLAWLWERDPLLRRLILAQALGEPRSRVRWWEEGDPPGRVALLGLLGAGAGPGAGKGRR